MKISLDQAEAIAKRVTKKLKEWEIPISVKPSFVIMVSLVIRELRAEAKRQTTTQNPDEESAD